MNEISQSWVEYLVSHKLRGYCAAEFMRGVI